MNSNGISLKMFRVSGASALVVFFYTLFSLLVFSFMFSGSVYASTPNAESDFEFDSSTGRITGYVGESTDVVIPSTIGGVAVTSIEGNAFFYNNLTSVVIPDSVTSIGMSAFDGNNLTSVVIPDSVTSIDYSAFSQNKLTSVEIPDSVMFIGSNAFRENSNLETVFIKGEPTIVGTTTFSRTDDVSGNTNVTLYGIPNSSVQAYADANGHPFINIEELDFEFDSSTGTITGYTGTSKDVMIPSTIGGVAVTSIGNNAFQNNNLTSVMIPDSVTSIGSRAFQDNKLTSMVIPDSVTSIGNSAFSFNNLTSVVIPDGVTSIGDNAFYNNNLTSVTIPDNVTSIGSWAFRNNELTSVTIPDSVTSIGGNAFRNNNLTSVTIPDGVTSIETGAFYGNNLTSVTIPDSVTSIGFEAFRNNALTSVEIPDSVTSIRDTAFYNNNLTSVVIPDSVESIGNYAFRNNPNLETVIIKGEPTITGTTTFSRTSNESENTNVTLYGIPNSSVQTYADANGHPFNALSVEDTLESVKNVMVNILSGGLNLFVPDIEVFGAVTLTEEPKIYSTGFQDDFAVEDYRGTHEGWGVTVAATQLVHTDGHKIPKGSLTLKGVNLNKDGVSNLHTTTAAIDNDEPVKLLNAVEGTGAGTTNFNFADEPIGFSVNPETVKAGKYASVITWTLENAPIAD